MSEGEGYLEEKLETELVLKPETIAKAQWKFLKKIFGWYKNDNIINITLPEGTVIKFYINNE